VLRSSAILDPSPVLSPQFASNSRYQLRTLRGATIPADRTISIYLPVAYRDEPDRRFPVFYLHDGQNLFDGTTSYLGRAEGAHHLCDTDLLFSILIEQGWETGCTLVYQRILGGLHNEDAWADRFGDVLCFLFPARRPSLLMGEPAPDEPW